MELYLLRHAIAEENSPSGRDADRRLTDEGRDKLRRVLKRASSAGVEPSLILSSPYKRALETAEIAATELRYRGEILRVGSLTPDSSPPSIWSDVRDHRDLAIDPARRPRASFLRHGRVAVGLAALHGRFQKSRPSPHRRLRFRPFPARRAPMDAHAQTRINQNCVYTRCTSENCNDRAANVTIIAIGQRERRPDAASTIRDHDVGCCSPASRQPTPPV